MLVLFFLTKLMGDKQISQLNFFDYVIGISIGSIAAQMACDKDMEYISALVAMIIYSLIALSISYFTTKSIKLRRLLNGIPLILLKDNEFIKENFKKSKMDLNDFMLQARISGYFNVTDIKYAVLETNGKISFIPNASTQPITAKDLNIQIEQPMMTSNVIIDGKIMIDNLKNNGLDIQWLQNQLKIQNIKSEKNVFLGILDDKNNLSLYLNSSKKIPKTNFI